jgi:2-oxoglutarate ferredoxin oxidoreductase subunit delta
MAKGKIEIDRERCKGCYICVSVCPSGNLTVDEQMNKKGYRPASFDTAGGENKKGCTGCAMCATVCPDVAIEVYRAK